MKSKQILTALELPTVIVMFILGFLSLVSMHMSYVNHNKDDYMVMELFAVLYIISFLLFLEVAISILQETDDASYVIRRRD